MEISQINPDGNVYDIKDAISRTEIAQIKAQGGYSTEEMDTGKKWIDGKTVFRRVITLTNPDISWTRISLAPYFGGGVSTIIDASKVNGIRSTGMAITGDFYQSPQDFFQHLVLIDPGETIPNLLIKTQVQFTTLNIVIEYTK